MITNLRRRLLEEYGPGCQNRVARELGINQARLSQYATGTLRIPPHHMLKLAEALHCSPTEIIGYSELESLYD